MQRLNKTDARRTDALGFLLRASSFSQETIFPREPLVVWERDFSTLLRIWRGYGSQMLGAPGDRSWLPWVRGWVGQLVSRWRVLWDLFGMFEQYRLSAARHLCVSMRTLILRCGLSSDHNNVARLLVSCPDALYMCKC